MHAKYYTIISVHAYSTNTTRSSTLHTTYYIITILIHLLSNGLISVHCQCYIIIFFSGLVPFVLIFGLNIATYRKICQMQKENFEIRRGASYQREHEIKLSQISLAIAAGMYLSENE